GRFVSRRVRGVLRLLSILLRRVGDSKRVDDCTGSPQVSNLGLEPLSVLRRAEAGVVLVEPAAVSYETFRGQNVNLTLVCFLERFSHINAMVQFDLLFRRSGVGLSSTELYRSCPPGLATPLVNLTPGEPQVRCP